MRRHKLEMTVGEDTIVHLVESISRAYDQNDLFTNQVFVGMSNQGYGTWNAIIHSENLPLFLEFVATMHAELPEAPEVKEVQTRDASDIALDVAEQIQLGFSEAENGETVVVDFDGDDDEEDEENTPSETEVGVEEEDDDEEDIIASGNGVERLKRPRIIKKTSNSAVTIEG